MTDKTLDPGAYLAGLFGLSGQVAVVIGGTSGLGAASAVGLGRAGAHVVVAGREQARAAGVVAAIEAAGGAAQAAAVDVLDGGSIDRLAASVLDRHGRVDILVNAAGIFTQQDSADADEDTWRRIVETNLTGTWLACQAFGRHMLAAGRGSIVNFGSTDAVVGVPTQAAYCASKGAVLQLTRTLGAEWAPRGVRVNAVGPSDFATPMIEPFLADADYNAWITDAIPMGRVGQPDEIVGAVLFLASPAAAMVAGSHLMVDGGRTVI